MDHLDTWEVDREYVEDGCTNGWLVYDDMYIVNFTVNYRYKIRR
jgi:hypothetical protein